MLVRKNKNVVLKNVSCFPQFWTIHEKNYDMVPAVSPPFRSFIFLSLQLQKTRGTWRLLLGALILTFILLVVSSERRYHRTLVGIALSFLIFFIMFRQRKYYTMPSVTLGRPEIAVAIITIIFTISYGVGGSLLFGNEFSPPITNLGFPYPEQLLRISSVVLYWREIVQG